MTTDKKSRIYSRLRIAGALTLMPFVVAAGPLAGYIAGDYLHKRLGLPEYVCLISVLVGIASSIVECIRIIKFALKSLAKG